MRCLCAAAERDREGEVLARTPLLCGHKEEHLVPGGGLFTSFTLTSAKSPLQPPLSGQVESGAQINGCPVNCIIDLLMDPQLEGGTIV